MKRSSTYLLFLAMVLLHSCQDAPDFNFFEEDDYVNACADSSKLDWDERNRLEWSDFSGKIDSTSTFDAFSATEICYSYEWEKKVGSIMVNTEVKTFFLPQESWCQKENLTEKLLVHEQGHFDISEIHARKLRKLFSEFHFTDRVDIEIDSIFDAVIHERDDMDKQYDLETKHSVNQKKQTEWNQLIHDRLMALEDYK